jgi:hypothetical protein
MYSCRGFFGAKILVYKTTNVFAIKMDTLKQKEGSNLRSTIPKQGLHRVLGTVVQSWSSSNWFKNLTQ